MTPDLLDHSRSRAALIGISHYRNKGLEDLPSSRGSLTGLHRVLTDPNLCGWPPTSILPVPNPKDPAETITQLRDLAREAENVFLLYYVGHGLLTPTCKLCLTVSSTDPDSLEESGILWSRVHEVLSENCRARLRLTVLDCCFAGQATTKLSGPMPHTLAGLAQIDGVYTLTATQPNDLAEGAGPRGQTAFTGELLDLLDNGVPHGSPYLTLDDVYRQLDERLRVKGLPRPGKAERNAANNYPLTRNAALGRPLASWAPRPTQPDIWTPSPTDSGVWTPRLQEAKPPFPRLRGLHPQTSQPPHPATWSSPRPEPHPPLPSSSRDTTPARSVDTKRATRPKHLARVMGAAGAMGLAIFVAFNLAHAQGNPGPHPSPSSSETGHPSRSPSATPGTKDPTHAPSGGTPSSSDPNSPDTSNPKPVWVSVPTVTNLDEQSAKDKLDEVDLVGVTDSTDCFNSDAKPGVVAGQDPSGGKAKQGSTVHLKVQANCVTMPGIVGDPISDAEPQLTNAGLGVNKDESGCDEDKPQGTVLATDPEAGASVRRDRTVLVTVNGCGQPPSGGSTA
ncbi:caspase, EACC1-associated type [Streptomyces spinosirectus]